MKNNLLKGTELKVKALSHKNVINIVKTNNADFDSKGFCCDGKLITFHKRNNIFYASFDGPTPEWYSEVFHKS